MRLHIATKARFAVAAVVQWRRWSCFLLVSAFAFLALCSGTAAADAPTAADLEFFESRIRPALAEHCYECHSAQAKTLQGNLRLDTRDALRQGGDSGPAIEPGDAGGSLLLEALRYESLEMPPDGKLPEAVIADFAKWIELGAPDPRTDEATAGGDEQPPTDFAKARQHWAFQPIRRPDVPPVADAAWQASPIDALVYAKLAEAGLSPSPKADRRTLIRRVYFDLIGLPPTYEEVETFVNDSSPDAYAQLVDRLLASPHYGERWGRHWLDVARYADTKDGVLMYGDDRIRPYAYTYRDYVIRSFNDDVPFDQFVGEQLAADQIEPPVAPWKLAGMGLLTLGKMFDDNLPDIYDDQIDVVARGFLGLTVTCARCHDHKYDAITQADYYGLYGVFASTEVPLELPLIGDPTATPGCAEFDAKARPVRQKLADHIDAQYRQTLETSRQRVGDYLVRVATEKPDLSETAYYGLSLSPEDLRPMIVGRWRKFLEQRATPNDPVFGPWHDLMAINADAPDKFTQQASEITRRWESVPVGTASGHVNPLVQVALASAEHHSKRDVAQTYGQLFQQVDADAKRNPPPDDPADPRRQLLDVLYSPDGPIQFPKRLAYLCMSRVPRTEYGAMLVELDKLAVTEPGAPPRAMVVADSPDLHNPRIFLRGNPAQLGGAVPRRFLELLGGGEEHMFQHGSGRLDLARAITAPDNPLTARVMANRIWMGHFGEPLVSSPSDFGTRSTPPTHPELLDWLAAEFMAPTLKFADHTPQPWSIKHLHRAILLSQTYQQASFDRPQCRQVDPDNRLLWRANRRRLDLEAMRDSLLAYSRRLDRTQFGRPVDVAGDPENCRRTVYGLVDRQSLPGLFRVFDFANPDQTAERRPQTTTPLQALFGMNSPFVIEQAKALAHRAEMQQAETPADRVAALYRIVLQRSPTTSEITAAIEFVKASTAEQAATSDASQLGPWKQYAQVLLLTNEAMFVD